MIRNLMILLLALVAIAGCQPATEPGAAIEATATAEGEAGPTPTSIATATLEAASSGAADPTALPAATPEPAATAAAIPQSTPTAAPAGEAAIAARAGDVAGLARDDLARRLQLEPGQIEIVSVEEVDWPNAALGCPLPGTQYAQVVTPGFIVILQAGEENYEYHTDQERRIVLCNEEGMPLLPSIPVDPGEIQDGKPWMPVDPPESNSDWE